MHMLPKKAHESIENVFQSLFLIYVLFHEAELISYCIFFNNQTIIILLFKLFISVVLTNRYIFRVQHNTFFHTRI